MPEKILIVDDDVDSLKLMGLMLQRNGYEVIAANAGNQALAKATSELPDLIILDVMMPDMNGYEVCRRLRAESKTQSIPIIMFTAKTLIDDKVAGFEAGADDYLTKPTHPAELASRVKQILARSASQRAKPKSRGNTVGVIGAKGGVGTTSIALNLGAALLQAGEEPVLADFRLGTGSLGLFIDFGQTFGMANVISKTAKEITPQIVANALATHKSGLRALLSSSNPREAQINYTAASALAIIRSLRSIGRPAIFDLGCGYNAITRQLLQEMDQVILIVEPFGVTLTMARGLLNEIETDGGKQINIVVVSRSPSKVQTPWEEIEQILGHDLKAIISPAPDLAFQAAEAGVPMVLFQPGAIVSSQITKLSEALFADGWSQGSLSA